MLKKIPLSKSIMFFSRRSMNYTIQDLYCHGEPCTFMVGCLLSIVGYSVFYDIKTWFLVEHFYLEVCYWQGIYQNIHDHLQGVFIYEGANNLYKKNIINTFIYSFKQSPAFQKSVATINFFLSLYSSIIYKLTLPKNVFFLHSNPFRDLEKFCLIAFQFCTC